MPILEGSDAIVFGPLLPSLRVQESIKKIVGLVHVYLLDQIIIRDSLRLTLTILSKHSRGPSKQPETHEGCDLARVHRAIADQNFCSTL